MTTITLPTSDAPRASIVVLSRRNVEMLRACLTALTRNVGADTPFELIILLNGADDDVAAFCERDVAGARVEHSRVNLGFPAGCNLAAARARGAFLVFLNDDTQVAPRWLESLLQAADEHPEAGAIGSRLLFADGSVQEAGGVIWRDGTTAQVGRGRSPASPRYGCRRRVDYCSAASLLVRKSTWDLVGGFDENYYPGYYEDVDLCCAIRQHGQQVLYEPHSQVVHHVSPPLDAGVNARLFQRNAARVEAKWSALLASHELWDPGFPGAVERAMLRAQGWPRRILVIAERLPDPTAGAASARMFGAISELRSIGAAITVSAPQAPEGDWDLSSRLGFDVLEGSTIDHLAAAEVFYDAVIVSGPDNLALYLCAIRALQPQAGVIYDAGDRAPPELEHHAAGTPDAVTAEQPAGSWIDLFAQARSRRVDEYV